MEERFEEEKKTKNDEATIHDKTESETKVSFSGHASYEAKERHFYVHFRSLCVNYLFCINLASLDFGLENLTPICAQSI